MGVFRVKACIWNPLDPGRSKGVELLVDTGATYTVISRDVLESLKIEVLRHVRLRLADDRVIERPLGEVGIEIEGYKASATPVVFGDPDIYILGSVTMEQLGLAPDPVTKKLKPVEALLM
ncbi:MAG: Retroviral aspartyl protease [Desulfurococcales archaeon ex4484_204]|nr:MAG: Retroviral aspartyl protease [Desulfurococcales archaeon ex4484_204]